MHVYNQSYQLSKNVHRHVYILFGLIQFSAASTAHPYVTFTSVSVSPSPVVLPGNMTIGVQGTVHHHFGTDVRMVVKMDKLLLGQWTKVPCSQNVGSWFVQIGFFYIQICFLYNMHMQKKLVFRATFSKFYKMTHHFKSGRRRNIVKNQFHNFTLNSTLLNSFHSFKAITTTPVSFCRLSRPRARVLLSSHHTVFPARVHLTPQASTSLHPCLKQPKSTLPGNGWPQLVIKFIYPQRNAYSACNP